MSEFIEKPTYHYLHDDCQSCPFKDRDSSDYPFCTHPKAPFDSDIVDMGRLPKWCPLRTENSLIKLI